MESQKIIFEEQISKEIAIQKKWEEKIKTIKTKIEKDSQEHAKLITNIEIVVFYVLIIILFFISLNSLPKIIAVIPALFGILGFFGMKFDFRHVKSSSVDKKFNLIYQKKLKELKLE